MKATYITVVIIIVSAALISGCVSSEKYKLSLDAISARETEISDIESRLYSTEERLLSEGEARAAAESEVNRLRTDLDAMTADAEQREIEADRLNRINDMLSGKIEALELTLAETNEEKLRTIGEKEKEIAKLTGTYDNLVSELNEEIKKGEIEVTQLKDRLSLSMVEKILFDSGSAAIKKNGKKILERVADILGELTDRQIRIEGHTDNVPIGSLLARTFPTNWELSTARATTVVRYLEEKGVNPSFLSAAGYSEFKPVDTNETREGKAKNRRIEIVLTPLDADRIAD